MIAINPRKPGAPATLGPAGRRADRFGERLPRKLGVWSAVAVIVGSTIGSGIFRTPSDVAAHANTLPLFVGAWLAGSAVALAGAVSFAELSALMPRSGGVYVYLREAFGRRPAFLFGWAELWILRPAAYAAIAITSAEYLWRCVGVDGDAAAWGLPLSVVQVTAVGLIAIVGAVNVRGLDVGALVQNVSTVLKTLAVVLLIGVGLYLVAVGSRPAPASSPATPVATSALAAFGLAMVPVLWSYDGWSDVGFVGGEVKDPQRNLPRAFILGTAAVAGLYLAVNAAYLAVFSLQDLPGRELIAADVAEAAIGPVGVVLVSGAVALSTFGTLNGSMMTGPRIFYAMAEDGLFFRRLADVQPRFGTPAVSIGAAVVLGGVFSCVQTFAELAEQFVIVIWPFYALAVVAVFVLRRREPDRPRPYKTWGYPVVPALFLVAAAVLLLNFAVTQPLTFAVNLGVVALGIPVYELWLRER